MSNTQNESDQSVEIEKTSYGCNIRGKVKPSVKTGLALVYAEYVKDMQTPQDKKSWMFHSLQLNCTACMEAVRLVAAKEIPWHSDIRMQAFPTEFNSMRLEFSYALPVKSDDV